MLPGPVHAARLLRRGPCRRPSPPTASTARATSRRRTTIDGLRAFSIEGRIKDLINRGGEKINAEEVELLLLAHPHVVEAALVAMPDPRLGERGCAFLATDGTPVTLEDLRDHLRTLDVAKFKWPERVELLEALPRTKVGKLDKKAMTADITARLENP